MSDASEVSKPFECTSPGCKQTFTNEDHLSSHQKRHEMSLLLPGGITISRSNSLLTLGADLTPTPTRFIRIGDEVGLFQDLLKANPFDEQFRKAAEQNKAASVHLPLPFSGACDEPLNTPHIVHPGDGEHHAAKGAATPAMDTPLPRLASPHRLGSPPPAHVVVTPCSPPRSRGGAPPAHRDPLDPDGAIDMDDDMEVEGPLDMRSPSVMPSVSETLISPPVIQHTLGCLSSPPVIHPAVSLSDQNRSLSDQNRSLSDQNRPLSDQSRSLSDQNRSLSDQNRSLSDQNRPLSSPSGLPSLSSPHLMHHSGALGSPHGVQTPPGSSGSLGSPTAMHTPTTVQSSAVSSTVASPRYHQLAVPPPLRPRPVPSSGAVQHAGPLVGMVPGPLSGPLPAAHQPSQPAALPAHQNSHHGSLPSPLSADSVEFQLKLPDGQVIPLTMQASQAAAAAAARVPGRMTTPPAEAAGTPGGEMTAAGTVRERLKRSLQRQERPPAPALTPPMPPAPAADLQPTLLQPRSPQSEDSLRKERNRAAANRWRARKKRAQQQMATSMESLNCNVRELRHENADLRAQVARLELLLAQHRDCDVTRGLKPLEADGPSRLELEDLSRLMAGEGAVSPVEEARRGVRPGMPSVSGGASAASVWPGSVSTLAVSSTATHQLILLQPAPAGGPRLPQQQQQQQQQHHHHPQQQQQQQQQQATQMRHYRTLPAVSAAGHGTLQPPLAHGERHC